MGGRAALPRLRARRRLLKLAQARRAARATGRVRAAAACGRRCAADPRRGPRGCGGGRAPPPRGPHGGSAGRLAHWRALDPTSSLLRYEAVRLGTAGRCALRSSGGGPRARARPRGRVHGDSGCGATPSTSSTAATPRPAACASSRARCAPQDDPEVAYYRGYAREKSGGRGRRLRGRIEAVHALRLPEPRPSRWSSCAARWPRTQATRLRTSCSARCCWRRAAPTDAVPRVAGGAAPRPDAFPSCIATWAARCFRCTATPAGALAVFDGRRSSADPTNVDLYQGADQALSLLGRPAAERIALFRRYPDARAMPPELLQRLALALAEGGRADEGEALLAGPLLPARGVAAPTCARCSWRSACRRRWPWRNRAAAPRRWRSSRGWSRKSPDSASRRTASTRSCARRARSTRPERWRPWPAIRPGPRLLDGGRGSDGGLLPRPGLELRWPRAGWEARTRRRGVRGFEPPCRESDTFLEAGTSFPGVVIEAQGMLLQALGREDEARTRLRQALVLPDQRLSHFLARRALQGAPDEERHRRRLRGHRRLHGADARHRLLRDALQQGRLGLLQGREPHPLAGGGPQLVHERLQRLDLHGRGRPRLPARAGRDPALRRATRSRSCSATWSSPCAGGARASPR